MPNWKKVVVSGSDAHLASLHTSADITGSGIYISGSATTTGSFGYIQTVGEVQQHQLYMLSIFQIYMQQIMVR